MVKEGGGKSEVNGEGKGGQTKAGVSMKGRNTSSRNVHFYWHKGNQSMHAKKVRYNVNTELV